MLLGNVALQASALLILLLVPKLLPVADYGRVSVMLTLLSVLPLADLGLSNVYNRKLPGLLADQDHPAVQGWNSLVLRLRVWGSAACAVIAATGYYLKYQDPWVAGLLLPMGFASGCTTLLVTRYTAMSQFTTVTRLNVAQAVLRLTTIPFCAAMGLAGWCLGALASATGVLLFSNVRRNLYRDWIAPALDRKTVLRALPEGLSLVAVSFLWMQLLYIGRSYAAFAYGDVDTASYGLVNSGYQFAASLLIAFFVPQTITTYRLIKASKREALSEVLRILTLFFPINAAITLAGTMAAPFVLRWLFPNYAVPAGVNDGLLLSLLAYPQLLLLGSLLIGLGKSRLYLMLTLLCLVASVALAAMATHLLGVAGAAYGQLGGIVCLSLCLSVAAYWFYREDGGAWHILVFCAIGSTLLPVLFCTIVRDLVLP